MSLPIAWTGIFSLRNYSNPTLVHVVLSILRPRYGINLVYQSDPKSHKTAQIAGPRMYQRNSPLVTLFYIKFLVRKGTSRRKL